MYRCYLSTPCKVIVICSTVGIGRPSVHVFEECFADSPKESSRRCMLRQTQSESPDPWKVSARRIRSLPTVACIVWLRSAIVHSRSKSSNVQRIITITLLLGRRAVAGDGHGDGGMDGRGREWEGGVGHEGTG